nr:MAG TPA: hypothetical protein [Caudoviricetes sp.]
MAKETINAEKREEYRIVITKAILVTLQGR